MAFTFEELQSALQNQMGGHGVKKQSPVWEATKAGVTKAATVVGGILPVTQNQMKREVGKLEENDAQAMSYITLVVDRLAELGIDLDITGDDIAERQVELLESYRDRQEATKQLAKEARKLARQAKFAGIKEQWNMNGPKAQETDDDCDIIEVVKEASKKTEPEFDEPADDEEEVVQPATTYIFKGVPEEDEE